MRYAIFPQPLAYGAICTDTGGMGMPAAGRDADRGAEHAGR